MRAGKEGYLIPSSACHSLPYIITTYRLIPFAQVWKHLELREEMSTVWNEVRIKDLAFENIFSICYYFSKTRLSTEAHNWSALKWLWNVYHNPARWTQGSSWNRKDCKSQRHWTSVPKPCVLDMGAWLYTGTHSSCDSLHHTESGRISAWMAGSSWSSTCS